LTNYNTIIDFFDEYISHYKELLSFENKKLELIVENNVSELSTSLSREQALIMKGGSLETKRINLLKNEGLNNAKFQEIIDQAPVEYSTMLSNRFSELSKFVNEVKRINDNSLSIVKNKLSAIDKKLSNNLADTYDINGGKRHSSNGISAVSKNI